MSNLEFEQSPDPGDDISFNIAPPGSGGGVSPALFAAEVQARTEGDIALATDLDTEVDSRVEGDTEVANDAAEALSTGLATKASHTEAGLILPRQPGYLHGLQTRATNATYHYMLVVGRMALVPIYVPAGAYDALALNVSVAAASTWRFGLYPSDPVTLLPDGLPLIADLGTMNMASATLARYLTCSLNPTAPTLYWGATLCEAFTAAPTAYVVGGTVNAQVEPPWMNNIQLPGQPTRNQVTRINPVVATGAMPATCPSTVWSDFGPWLTLRAA